MLSQTLLDRLNKISSLISIADIDPRLNIDRYCTCPACNRVSKAKVNRDSIKCMHPHCELHKGMKSVNYYAWLHQISFKQALTDLENKLGINYYNQFKESPRDEFLKKAMVVYHNDLDKNKVLIEDYVHKRGWDKYTIELFNLTYARNAHDILQPYIPTETLLINKFLNERGVEYFRDRLLFPVYNQYAELVHLIGRAINSYSTPRYKATKEVKEYNIPAVTNYLAFEHCIKTDIQSKTDTIYLVEGYPDSLTLRMLGIPSLGLFGLTGINKHTYKLNHYKNLVCLFDSDIHTTPSHIGIFKSWDKIIPQLIELQMTLPTLNISICYLPIDPNSKDINEFYKNGGDKSFFNSLPKIPFIKELLNLYGHNLSYHKHIMQLIKVTGKLQYLKSLRTFIPNGTDILDYCLAILDNE